MARGLLSGLNHVDNMLGGRTNSYHRDSSPFNTHNNSTVDRHDSSPLLPQPEVQNNTSTATHRSIDPPTANEFNPNHCNNMSSSSLSQILRGSPCNPPRPHSCSFHGIPVDTTPHCLSTSARHSCDCRHSCHDYAYDSSPQQCSDDADARSRRLTYHNQRRTDQRNDNPHAGDVPDYISYGRDSPSFRGSPAQKSRSSPNIVLSKYHHGDPGSRDFNKIHATATKAPPSKFKFSLCPFDSLIDSKAGSTSLAAFTTSHRLCTTNAVNHCQMFDMLRHILIPSCFDLSTGDMSPDTKNLFTNHDSFSHETLVEWQDYIELHFKPEDQVSSSWLCDWFMPALSNDLHDKVLQDYYDLPTIKQGAATLIKLAFDKIRYNSHEAKLALSNIITKFSIVDIKNKDVKLATSWLKSVIKALAGTNDIPQRALIYILDGMAKSSSTEFNSLCTMLKLQNSCLSAIDVDSEKNITSALDELNNHYRDQVQAHTWPKLSSFSSKSSSAFNVSPNQPFDIAALIAQNSDIIQALLSSVNHSDRICYNCKKPGHIAANCPAPFARDGLNRGRSHERKQHHKSMQSKSGSHGNSNSSAKSAKSNASQSQPNTIPIPPKRTGTPAPSKSVTYKNPQTYAAVVNTPASTSDYSPFAAYILHGNAPHDSSKGVASTPSSSSQSVPSAPTYDNILTAYLSQFNPAVVSRVMHDHFVYGYHEAKVSVNLMHNFNGRQHLVNALWLLNLRMAHIPLIIDTGASCCITPCKLDFKPGSYSSSDIKVRDLSGQNNVTGQVLKKLHNVSGSIEDDDIVLTGARNVNIFAPYSDVSNLPELALHDPPTASNFWESSFAVNEEQLWAIQDPAALSFESAHLNVLDDGNKNLKASQKGLLLWHQKLSHLNFTKVRLLTQNTHWIRVSSSPDDALHVDAILPMSHQSPSKAEALECKCAACLLAKACRRTPAKPFKPTVHPPKSVLKTDHLVPGQCVSVDHYVSPPIFGKQRVEADAANVGISIKKYHSDNGVFCSQEFQEHCDGQNQDLDFSAPGAKHQNGVAERAIGTLSHMACANLIHLMIHWPQHCDINLWALAMDYAVWVYNRTPRRSLGGLTPKEFWSGSRSGHADLKRAHVFGCPVYVLDLDLQDGKRIPKWNSRARKGMFVGFSSAHSSLCPLVLNLKTGHISPQYHIIFDDKFASVVSLNKSHADVEMVFETLHDAGFSELFLDPDGDADGDVDGVSDGDLDRALDGASDGVLDGASDRATDGNLLSSSRLHCSEQAHRPPSRLNPNPPNEPTPSFRLVQPLSRSRLGHSLSLSLPTQSRNLACTTTR
ncbi:hypothetical protein ACHAW6_009892 [Cyclotella cf. meneghiniana]